MSYIIKNSTQGAIVARLTDAGRKKLSEGKLNIGLFQLGDSEMCYDCYGTLPSQSNGINVLQAEHNAQNSLGFPEKNKGHIKYPITEGVVTGNTFGPTIPQHTHEEVFNTATARGFFQVPTQTASQALNGDYTYFSAQTGSLYTLSSNWTVCFSALTGSSVIQISSASCSTQQYSPVVGDMISVTYEYTTTDCSELNYTAASPTLFYQVLGGNTNSGQTNSTLELTLDRNIPNFYSASATQYSAYSATCAHVRVYPAFSANPMTTSSIYSSASSITYWCDDTLSFNGCCNISNSDPKIWNMNINWTHQVAGVDSPTYEGVDYYGSSGYCGTKEYFGYESNDGQTFSDQKTDGYHTNVIGGTWYYDSFDNVRVVLPEEQKAIGIIHYTNNATTDFYGEKFAMKQQGYNAVSTIGEAKNFKLHLPWLMWHKKHQQGSGTGTGAGNETVYGQTFYVDPPTYSVFPTQPNIMQSNININMNDEGLRYYHLWDDNVGSGSTPNTVGKVFPDYKMVIIDDEELLAAMSYKSNRSWTLPAPKIEKIPAGTGCPTGCTKGVLQTHSDSLYMTYMFVNSSGMTTGLHCNYYVYETLSAGEQLFDITFTLGSEFPYLRDFSLSGTGFDADGLYILTQIVPNGSAPLPSAWKYKDVTSLIPNHLVGDKISATNLINKTFYLTGDDTYSDCDSYSAQTDYDLNNFINIPQAAEPEQLQFGDEYFFYGTMETDIMATIYEMKHVVQLGQTQYLTSTNPTWVDYNNANNTTTDPLLTEIGLYDNENGFPDLMAIAKFQTPVKRTGTQQFVISIDF